MTSLTQRRIVGIGDALLAERGGTVTPAGLAIETALWAERFGHVGIPVSRLGQDDRARLIINALHENKIDSSHLQSDPDLPTARRVLRIVAGREVTGSARLDERAAFDNMQWDFDLVDVAQEADAVVFGMTAQRGGLSGSVIRRFLSECSGALRLFDLTNRATDDFDRTQALRCMETSDIVIIDQAAAATLLRRTSPPDLSSASIIKQVLEVGSVVMAVAVGEEMPAILHAGESQVPTTQAWNVSIHAPMRIALLHAQLRGDDLTATASVIDRVAAHVAKEPDARIPESILQST
jgi:sugar/nucleoside kinase (ribokinase family)